MARIRTFIAVDIGKAIRDKAIALQEKLARGGTDVKWVEPNNLHVTLLFLGEVDQRELPKICQLVADGARTRPAFSMTIETMGAFPNTRRPRILWIGVGQGTQELCALHDDIETPLEDLGYRREERRYTPHITLGRVKNDSVGSELAAALAQNTGWKGGQVDVREVLVMSSELGPQGPTYAVLSRAKLG